MLDKKDFQYQRYDKVFEAIFEHINGLEKRVKELEDYVDNLKAGAHKLMQELEENKKRLGEQTSYIDKDGNKHYTRLVND